MNHLKTNINGGFPVHLNDIRWMQNNILSMLKEFNYGLTDLEEDEYVFYTTPTFSGTNTVTVGEGWIFIHGELCFIPSHTYNGTHQAAWWIVEEIYDSEGFKTFQNGNSHNVYLQRYAKIQSGSLSSKPANAPLFDRNNPVKLYQRIRDKLRLTSVINWTNLPGASYTYGSPQGYPQIYRDDCGFVHFRGDWNNDDPDNNTIVGVLPIGFRPEIDIEFDYFYREHYNSMNIYGQTFNIKASTGVIKTVTGSPPIRIYLSNFPSFKAVV